jgi:hypothetical protein
MDAEAHQATADRAAVEVSPEALRLYASDWWRS